MSHLEPHRHFLPDGGSLNRYNTKGDFHQWYKFGRNPDVGTLEEDVWITGGLEVLPTGPTSMWIACEDNVNGQGQVFRIDGLDENWDYKTQDVTLQGNTPVLIGDANSWTRINRGRQVSAEPDPVGDVWINDDDTDFLLGVPQTMSTVHAFIDFTQSAQQTEKCMLTVPRGHVALIYSIRSSIADASSGVARSAEVFLEVQELATGATVANPSWAPFRRLDQHSMRSDGGSSAPPETYVFPLGPFGELTNIHIRATASAPTEILADMEIVTYKV